MRCKKCRKRLKRNEKFCTVCGYYNGEKEDGIDLNYEIEKEEITDNEDDLNEVEIDEDDLNEDDLSGEDDFYESDEYDYRNDIEFAKTKKDDADRFHLKANASGTKEKEFYYKNEDYLEAYIGEDYKLIKKSPFNIYAFILNWMYLLYRKLYVIGIIGLSITGILILYFKDNLLIYIGIMMFFLGLVFNKLYIFVSKIKVEWLLKKYDGTDKFELMKICKDKGGVNFKPALLIYFIFLIIIFLNIFTPVFNKNHNTKYWEENTTNEANCMHFVKIAYNDLKNHSINGKISGAVCQIKKNNKQYHIYMKTKYKNTYIFAYYKTKSNYLVYANNTQNVNELELKKVNKTITKEESKELEEKRNIETAYSSCYNKSKQEDQLIKTKKNESEKLNYIFSKEEIIR